MKKLLKRRDQLARQLLAVGEEIVEESNTLSSLHLDHYEEVIELGNLAEERVSEMDSLMDDLYEFAQEIEAQNEPSFLEADKPNYEYQLVRDSQVKSIRQ
jgi:hypothetical protein